jgi:two-component system, cell cycle response regulator
MTGSLRARFALRALWALGAVGFFALTAQAAFGVWGSAADELFGVYVYGALLALSGLVCLIRAGTVERERAVWTALGFGMLSWAAAKVLDSVLGGGVGQPSAPIPSHFLWLAFFPAAYVAILMLARERVREIRASMWLDAVVGGLAIAAGATALALGSEAGDGKSLLGLTYMLGGLLLPGFAVGALALTGWRPGRALGLLSLGLAVRGGVGGFVAWHDAPVNPTLVSAGFAATALVVAAAAWQPTADQPKPVEGWRVLALPTAFALAALAVLFIDLVTDVAGPALALALACLFAVIVRMSVAMLENHELLEGTRREALTDSLTGLSNRRRLMSDLERQVSSATGHEPRALMLFDLDGFKQYNDRFGHPVGDALLARLGRRLEAATGPRSVAYRLGGDEFCVLAAMPEPGAIELMASARKALSDRGRGFEVGASCGLVMIPAEAGDVSTALRLADQRLYAEKGASKRAVASNQTAGALIQVLRELEPEFDGHLHEVATLAHQVGTRLGLTRSQLDELIRAAELHDVGKVAVPGSILRKPGPLDDSEWTFVRQHTVVGDRILSAAPALSTVAHVVRSSHERYDGSGYPDGLTGDEIPLAARVVAVCDAYHAMTSDRPYRTAKAHWEAIEELRAESGKQFDPVVVAAFCEMMDAAAERAA